MCGLCVREIHGSFATSSCSRTRGERPPIFTKAIFLRPQAAEIAGEKFREHERTAHNSAASPIRSLPAVPSPRTAFLSAPAVQSHGLDRTCAAGGDELLSSPRSAVFASVGNKMLLLVTPSSSSWEESIVFIVRKFSHGFVVRQRRTATKVAKVLLPKKR